MRTDTAYKAGAVAVAALLVAVLWGTGQHAAGVLIAVLLALSTAFALGVKMMERSHPLGPDEVGVISGSALAGRLLAAGGPTRVKLSGQPLLLRGERLDRLPVSLQSVPFEVKCQSGDRWPVTIELKAGFAVPRDEAKILAIVRVFGPNISAMRDWVESLLHACVRDAAGRHTADQIDRQSIGLAGQAAGQAVQAIGSAGFISFSLAVHKVTLSDRWREEREQQAGLQARRATQALEIDLEGQRHAAAARREADARREGERARVDATLYAEQQRLKIQQEELALKNKQRREDLDFMDQQRRQDRAHEREMAELVAFRLLKELEVRSQYQEMLIREKIVEDLPQILEAKNKLAPNLRTYIAGERESGKEGLLGLLTGLATFGEPVMEEVRQLVGSLKVGGSAPEVIGGPPAALGAGESPTTRGCDGTDPRSSKHGVQTSPADGEG
jgi:hypothetical protein